MTAVDAEGILSAVLKDTSHSHNCSSSFLFFPHLTDEPESKKLAGESDLDSANALCEFIPLLFALWFCLSFGTTVALSVCVSLV